MLIDDDISILDKTNEFVDWSMDLKQSFHDQLKYYTEELLKDSYFTECHTSVGTLKAEPFPFDVRLHIRVGPDHNFLGSGVWEVEVIVADDSVNEINRCTELAFNTTVERIRTHLSGNYRRIECYLLDDIKILYPYLPVSL